MGSSTVYTLRSGDLMSSRVVYSVVDLPEPVGPTMTMPPSGALSAVSKRARLSPTRPSEASVGGSGETSSMRMVRFSPYMLGMDGEAQVHGLAARELEAGAAVLRQPPFGDVEVAHDLECG